MICRVLFAAKVLVEDFFFVVMCLVRMRHYTTENDLIVLFNFLANQSFRTYFPSHFSGGKYALDEQNKSCPRIFFCLRER